MSRPSSYPLRISEELRTRLEKEAKDNGRSYNAELATRLQVTVDIEDACDISLDYVSTYISDLEVATYQIKKLKDENESLKEKLRSLQSEFSSSFAISGADKAGVAILKLRRAQSHISTGLAELQSLLPNDKKPT